MIYDLRKKFIRISAITVTIVLLIIFFIIFFLGQAQLNDAMDLLTDGIPTKKHVDFSNLPSGSGGVTSGTSSETSQDASSSGTLSDGSGGSASKPKTGSRPDFDIEDFPGFLSEETPYSTRFFIVYTDKKEAVRYVNLAAIVSVDEDLAKKYVAEVFDEEKERGWIDDFRYKVTGTNLGSAIIFVDGSMNQAVARTLITTVGIVLLFSDIVILAAIILLSGKVIKPIAESYEKQKQFITDANHELKTPLSLILANADIAEKEIGKNEWIDDIRSEGERMSLLVNQLVALSRMDEEALVPASDEFNISDALLDTISEFSGRIENEGKKIITEVVPDLVYAGDEAMLRQLFSILIDNAVKYCDEGGKIKVSLSGKRRITLTMENSYSNVDRIELDKIFDRFFRADKVRTYSGSFGVGLSIAKGIVGKHHGEISAYKKDSSTIGFKVVLK